MPRLLVLYLLAATLAHQECVWGQNNPSCSCRSAQYNPTENDIVPRSAPPCRCGCKFRPQQQPRLGPVTTLSGFVTDSTNIQQAGPRTVIPTPPAVFVPCNNINNNQPSYEFSQPTHIMTIPRRSFSDSSSADNSDFSSPTVYSSDSGDSGAISTVYSTDTNSRGSTVTFSSGSDNNVEVTYSSLSPDSANSQQYGPSYNAIPNHVSSHTCLQSQEPSRSASYPLPVGAQMSNSILPSQDVSNSQQSNSVFQVVSSSSPTPNSTPQTVFFSPPPPLIASCPATVFYPASPAVSYPQPSVIVPAASPTSYTFQQIPTATNTLFSSSGPFNQFPITTNSVPSNSNHFNQFPVTSNTVSSNSGSFNQFPVTSNTVSPGSFNQFPVTSNTVSSSSGSFNQFPVPSNTVSSSSGSFNQFPVTSNTVSSDSGSFNQFPVPSNTVSSSSDSFNQFPVPSNTVSSDSGSFNQLPTSTNTVISEQAPGTEINTNNSVTDSPLTYKLLSSSTKSNFQDDNRDCAVPSTF